MKMLTYFNTALLLFLIIKPYWNRLSVDVDRTSWEKKPYGFHVMLWEQNKGIVPNSGKSIFSFNWRSSENIKDEISKKA